MSELKFKRHTTKPVEFETIKVTEKNFREIGLHIGAYSVRRQHPLTGGVNDKSHITYSMPANPKARNRPFSIDMEEGDYLIIVPERDTFDYNGHVIHLFRSYGVTTKQGLKTLAAEIDGSRFESE